MTTKTKKGKKKFPGIMRDAEILGVNRTHLFRVLTGERISKSLTERYRALKAKQEGGEK